MSVIETPATRQAWRHEVPATTHALPAMDVRAFASDLDALHAHLKASLGPEDLDHLSRNVMAGRLLSLVGFVLSGTILFPLAAVCLGLGNFARWAIAAHHVQHRGYDGVPGVPAHYHSTTFARGWRRWLDWADWLLPAAWCHEHNQLHHYHTSQLADPDLVEHHAWLLRRRWIPAPIKWLAIAFVACTWKILYYAPNTLWALRQSEKIRAASPAEKSSLETPATAWRLFYPGERLLLPVTSTGVVLWLRCYLPYAIYRFGLLPAPFLLWSTTAWTYALIAQVLGELLANLWSFAVIGPNHTGEDLHRYDQSPKGRGQFYLHQIMGAANYTSPNAVTDFLQGFLNYQIEHHLWPDLPALKYRQAAPQVREICARHGVPYIEEPLGRRVMKMVGIMTGAGTLRRI